MDSPRPNGHRRVDESPESGHRVAVGRHLRVALPRLRRLFIDRSGLGRIPSLKSRLCLCIRGFGARLVRGHCIWRSHRHLRDQSVDPRRNFRALASLTTPVTATRIKPRAARTEPSRQHFAPRASRVSESITIPEHPNRPLNRLALPLERGMSTALSPLLASRPVLALPLGRGMPTAFLFRPLASRPVLALPLGRGMPTAFPFRPLTSRPF